MSTEHIILLIMVFSAIFLLIISLVVPTFGTGAQAAKRLRSRINNVISSYDSSIVSVIREKYLRDLSPFERRMENLPGMEPLSRLIEQSGRNTRAYKVVLFSLSIAIAATVFVFVLTRNPVFSALAFLCTVPLPIMKIRLDRNKRMDLFEEQLPSAMDIISRALRAGYPFIETLQLIGQEMDDPVAEEFTTTYSDINYGMDIKRAFMALLQRVPSVSLVAMTTAVMVQYESGGNLAESTEKIASVLRQRFKFQRRVKTLTAEGRMSGWILALMPLGLAAALFINNPEYIKLLTENELGKKLIAGASILMAIGVFWIKQLINIKL